MKNDVAMRAEIKATGLVKASILVYADFSYYKTGVYRQVVGETCGLAHAK